MKKLLDKLGVWLEELGLRLQFYASGPVALPEEDYKVVPFNTIKLDYEQTEETKTGEEA